MKRFFAILFSVMLLLPWHAEAGKRTKKKERKEKDTTENNVGVYVGINLGAYFGNAHSAAFYNGAPENENNLNYIFNNQYYCNDIDTLLREPWEWENDYPRNMHYKPAISIGFYLKYNFINNFGAFLQFNLAKLTAQDAFSLTISPRLYPTFQDIRLYPIWGKEMRYNIDLGVSRMFDFSRRLGLSVDFGINLNNTLVKENKIRIDNPETEAAKEFSIVNVYLNQQYQPGVQLTEYNIRQGGIGYGLFLGTNLRLIFNDYISIDPGVSAFYSKINLKGYNSFRFHYYLFVRMTFKNISDIF